ncbi:hypothetical protein D3C81_1646090 [compost metagenome]
MHRVPILQARMLRVMPHGTLLKPGNAGVVHKDVQPAAFLQNLRGHALPVLFAPYIETQIAGAVTECLCNRAAEFVVYVGEVDKTILLHEKLRNRGADPLGRPCDECNPGSELAGHK